MPFFQSSGKTSDEGKIKNMGQCRCDKRATSLYDEQRDFISSRRPFRSELVYRRYDVRDGNSEKGAGISTGVLICISCTQIRATLCAKWQITFAERG